MIRLVTSKVATRVHITQSSFRALSSATGGCSSAFHTIENTDISIDGGISRDQLEFLSKNHKSLLYLCADGTDVGVIGGFTAVKELFGDNAKQVPVSPSGSAFCESPELQPVIPAIKLFKQLEAALDSLPKPAVVVCGTGARASMFVSSYLGVRNKLSSKDVLNRSKAAGFKYLGKPVLANWVTTIVDSLSQHKESLFCRQLFESSSSTYTYLLADKGTGDAIIIDPVLEMVERDAKLISQLNLNLKYAVNTHLHADHVTGSGLLKQKFPNCKSVLSANNTNAKADVYLKENERLHFGDRYVFAVGTPGHTNGCMSVVTDDLRRVFTGDTLLIRGCGRTDFQEGSSSALYHSVHDKLFVLPDSCIVNPAHDYNGHTESSIGEERKHNPRLTKSMEEFETIMAELNLPKPKQIDEAIPKNMRCGV